ncbi:Taz1-interactin-like proteing factor 1 [Rhizodiscina lignyota]|uniref:Autophagy-related protein 11 n=1 Tax=Rhizodiscina lignyota TaxID=1504668 RepID=A0A9P4M550_9PEZI|nr:Taz1-interactin-like proteing factor 1 [Rhizodiscina lignyota]
MSLSVFVAHTGTRLDADPTAFESLDSLRTWIADATTIPTVDQILLTEKGRHVKLPTLLIEKEIFVYDRALFSTSATPIEPPLSPIPDVFEPDQPPDTLANEKNIKAWEALFKARRDWTLNLVQQCGSMADVADRYILEQSVIERSLLIATANHDTHIRNVDQKHSDAKAWFDDVAREQEDHLQHWQADLARLETIAARKEFHGFFLLQEKTENGRTKGENLGAFVDRDVVRKAAVRSRTIIDMFTKRVADVGHSIASISANYKDLREGITRSQSQYGPDAQEEPGRLMKEINAVAKKVASDYDHVASLPAVPKSVTSASKLALLHTRNFLPAIAEYSMEMNDLVRRAVDQKNLAVSNALERMRAIASIESTLSSVHADINALDVPADDLEAFEQLSTVSRLPFVYGSLMVEAVRRGEWIEKMKCDSSTLAEEIAGYQEEEQRRRKKWLKNMSDVLRVDTMEGKTLGVEINLLGEENSWPEVSREELEEYLNALAQAGDLQPVIDNLAQAIKDMDKPTRQQLRRAKTFKAGSVHEAGFGRGSLMLRGEDEMRVFREANARLEEELKGQKSRVRKLEDLVHRQSHVGRLSLGSGFTPQGEKSPEPMTPDQPIAAASPRLEEQLSRRGSTASRRLSANQMSEEKGLARKLVKLEAELLAERVARADLEKEALSRQEGHEDVKRQIDEAISTKKDIMENMEAQQKEFAIERRSLEEELSRAKQRIEEAEDELDRVLGSRDQERAGADGRLQSLIGDLDQFRKESAEEHQKAEDRIKELEDQINKKDQTDYERKALLADVWNQFSTQETAPEDHSQLISGLEDLARRSVDQLRDLQRAVALAKSENDTLQTTIDEQKTEMTSLTSQISEHEEEGRKLRDELNAERSRASSLSAELNEDRQRLKELQDTFTEGETGKEALRMRMTESENRAVRLSAQLAEAQSHANGLDVELSILQKKHDKMQGTADLQAERLQQRSQRAKDLTERLYTQTDRLRRLLETLGFAVTHQDDTMIIQRASKANSSTILSDASMSLTRSVSTPAPVKRLSEELDLSILHWMEKDDVDEENKKYTDYLATLDKFDLALFSDAIAKRMRDIEHTARKWQKEARSYRDKSHRAASDAHDKIAFRGFKEGDLALFLPTRNQATRPWAAFNVGAPHYFLREQEGHKLHNKEWLVARISKIEERVVDLSKTMDGAKAPSDGRSIGETSDGVSFEDDNPFDLSDGLRWYLLDAAEEKTGAPTTLGLGRPTVGTAKVDARGSIRINKSRSGDDASKNLSRSLDSRRSSTNSKKGVPAPGGADAATGPSHLRTSSNASSLRPKPDDSADAAKDDAAEVRHDQLFGP